MGTKTVQAESKNKKSNDVDLEFVRIRAQSGAPREEAIALHNRAAAKPERLNRFDRGTKSSKKADVMAALRYGPYISERRREIQPTADSGECR